MKPSKISIILTPVENDKFRSEVEIDIEGEKQALEMVLTMQNTIGEIVGMLSPQAKNVLRDIVIERLTKEMKKSA